MTLFVIILLGVTFFQGALLPVNLVLMVILVKSFVTNSPSNYWLAFLFGLLVSLLSGYPLGLVSILYLIFVAVVYIVKQVEFSSHWLLTFALIFILLTANRIVLDLFTGASFGSGVNSGVMLAEAVLILPVLFLVRLWEERFIPPSAIRLKVSR